MIIITIAILFLLSCVMLVMMMCDSDLLDDDRGNHSIFVLFLVNNGVEKSRNNNYS